MNAREALPATGLRDAAALPLAGVRIIAVEQYGAGPFGTQHLADLGAEVIKIENPNDGGDVGREVGPHYFGEGDSHFYQSFNRNKKSITLDLKKPEGREALRRLARDADVRAAFLDRLQHGVQHAHHGSEGLVFAFVEPPLSVEMPEQLVRAVDQMDNHGIPFGAPDPFSAKRVLTPF